MWQPKQPHSDVVATFGLAMIYSLSSVAVGSAPRSISEPIGS